MPPFLLLPLPPCRDADRRSNWAVGGRPVPRTRAVCIGGTRQTHREEREWEGSSSARTSPLTESPGTRPALRASGLAVGSVVLGPEAGEGRPRSCPPGLWGP